MQSAQATTGLAAAGLHSAGLVLVAVLAGPLLRLADRGGDAAPVLRHPAAAHAGGGVQALPSARVVGNALRLRAVKVR